MIAWVIHQQNWRALSREACFRQCDPMNLRKRMQMAVMCGLTSIPQAGFLTLPRAGRFTGK